MKPVTKPIQEFFDRFERDSNSSDPSAAASLYADSFLIADPQGAKPLRKQDLIAALPRREGFFKSFGLVSTKIASLDETPLDDFYSLVRVEWEMHFEPLNAAPRNAILASTYLLYLRDGSPEIVLYLMHQDLPQALQAQGIMPATP